MEDPKQTPDTKGNQIVLRLGKPIRIVIAQHHVFIADKYSTGVAGVYAIGQWNISPKLSPDGADVIGKEEMVLFPWSKVEYIIFPNQDVKEASENTPSDNQNAG